MPAAPPRPPWPRQATRLPCRPEPHGYTEITYDRDRIPTHHLTETLSGDAQ